MKKIEDMTDAEKLAIAIEGIRFIGEVMRSFCAAMAQLSVTMQTHFNDLAIAHGAKSQEEIKAEEQRRWMEFQHCFGDTQPDATNQADSPDLVERG